jgi:hypothetical protein
MRPEMKPGRKSETRLSDGELVFDIEPAFFRIASAMIISFYKNSNKSNKRPDSVTWNNEHLNKMHTTMNFVILTMLWQLHSL